MLLGEGGCGVQGVPKWTWRAPNFRGTLSYNQRFCPRGPAGSPLRPRYVPGRHFRAAEAPFGGILRHIFGLGVVSSGTDSDRYEAQRMFSRDAVVLLAHGSNAVRRIDEEAKPSLNATATSAVLGVGG